MKLDDLKPNPKNPRKITDKKLKALKNALDEFGDLGGIVFNRRTQQLIGGHQRMKVFTDGELIVGNEYLEPTPTGTVRDGYIFHNGEKWSYREVDWDEEKEKAANIAANKGAGEWDMALLGDWFKELDANEFDLDLTMFDKDERDQFFKDIERTGNTDPDDAPKVGSVSRRSSVGDLWILGNHRLMCGDSTQISDVEKLMGGTMADMVWTDPPYNVDYTGKTAEALTIKNDKMTDEKFRSFLQEVFTNCFIATKEGGAIYVAHADSEGYNFRGAMLDSGWLVKQCLIWAKSCLVMGRQDYQWMHEPILYGWKPGASHTWCSDRKQTTLLKFDKPSRNDIHPTMKPVDLVEYCIRNSTHHNAVVLDLFMGSGTTLIACEKSQREAYGMELDPKYCDVILERWEKYTGQTALLSSEGLQDA